MSLLLKGGIRRLSELDIDANKDWQGKGVTNLAGIATGMGIGHIAQHIALSAALSWLGFAALGFAFASGSLASLFGLNSDRGLDLVVAAIAAQPLLHFVSPLMSFLSRRAEYQADNFAKAMAGPSPMISALKKLARSNLTTLTPDALYASIYYSHPPVPARIARLSGV